MSKEIARERKRIRKKKLSPMASKNWLFEVSQKLYSLHDGMNLSSCTYRKWDLTRGPFCNTIAYAIWLEEDAEKFVRPFFQKSIYVEV